VSDDDCDDDLDDHMFLCNAKARIACMVFDFFFENLMRKKNQISCVWFLMFLMTFIDLIVEAIYKDPSAVL
jgi:hypothetical protein